MSDISKINVDGVDYDVKDVTARTEITPIERGGTGNSTIDGSCKTLLTRPLVDANNVIDANSISNIGLYKINISVASGIDPSTYNFPARFGMLLIFNATQNIEYDYVFQMFISYENKLYTRFSSNKGTTWTDWKTVTSS